MPSEMFERGRRDAEADALDENYYQYYYDYKLAYDEVIRNRRRSRRQRLLARAGRLLIWLVPLLLLTGGVGYAGYRYVVPERSATASPTTTPTLRPTLVPPTPRPDPTPTSELVLRADSFAVITGTQGAPLRARTAPGTDSDIVTRFPEGATVKVLEGPADASGMVWWRIEGAGQIGWASASFLQPVPAPQ